VINHAVLKNFYLTIGFEVAICIISLKLNATISPEQIELIQQMMQSFTTVFTQSIIGIAEQRAMDFVNFNNRIEAQEVTYRREITTIQEQMQQKDEGITQMRDGMIAMDNKHRREITTLETKMDRLINRRF
jgi:hypothetical protein